MSGKIFVAIPSFMDSELIPTIKDLFTQTSDPGRLDVYVFNQGEGLLLGDYNVTEILVPYKKSKGLCWALQVLQQCIDPVHQYYAQFDSHIRFDEGWDDTLIEQLADTTKVAITAYPGRYYLDSPEKTKGVVENFIGGYRETGSAVFGSRPSKNNLKSTIAGGFLFAPIQFILENPVDGYMNFEFIEFEQTLRAISNGWELKAPSVEGICYHYYGKDNKLTLHHVDDTRGISQPHRLQGKVNRSQGIEVNCNSQFNSESIQFGKTSLHKFEIDYQTKLPQLKTQKFISIPVAVANEHFKWQLELFWYRHKKVYGMDAKNRAKAIIIERNKPSQEIPKEFGWSLDIPFETVLPYFDYRPEFSNLQLVQSNVQLGLRQILHTFDDEDVLELLDCDLFHMKPHPTIIVGDDELYCDTVYENWHLKATTDNNYVISPYFENGGECNGGFVPIIAKVKTFKKIIEEWVNVNVDIVKRDLSSNITWWSAMYALQAACEKANVKMLNFNNCYIHGITEEKEEQYICHYSVDGEYIHKNNKKHLFSKENLQNCKNSKLQYANQFGEWLEQSGYVR